MSVSPNSTRLKPAVLAAREAIAAGRAKVRTLHDAASPGVQVCAHLTGVIESVVLDLFDAALAEVGDKDLANHVALAPYGGFGRRDMAPYSDVDLMVLCEPGCDAKVTPLMRLLQQHVCDAGLVLGFSIRTPQEACALALGDATIFTSLVDARFLIGNEPLFQRFVARFRHAAHRRFPMLLAAMEKARREERQQHGETIYLLRPNIKRSVGGLRDLQLLRWVGFARYGEADPEKLYQAGELHREDRDKLRDSLEFLLRLRNEMHFHAGKSQDVLDRFEQVRLAERFGFQGGPATEPSDGKRWGLESPIRCALPETTLPVEAFMQHYIDRTNDVHYIVSHFVDSARPRAWVKRLWSGLFSHNVERDFRVGPLHIQATPRGLAKVRDDLGQVLRLMELAALYDKPIDHATWTAIRTAMQERPLTELPAEARRRFLSLMSQPGQLGPLLRRLHELRVLEQLVPPMKHARHLVQFNDYHKFTVDEHSIRAVEAATRFHHDHGPLGEAYRTLKDKRTLHLALLLHDLGKGYTEEHCLVGQRLSIETAAHLGLSPRETLHVSTLVLKHLDMSHITQRRDINDDAVVAQFAAAIGSPDLLQMLYVLTCADLAAVGPGVLNDWKLQLITELYRRARAQMTGDAPLPGTSERLRQRREEILAEVPAKERDAWLDHQIASLPSAFLLGSPAPRIVEDLRRLRGRAMDRAIAWGRFLPEQSVVEYTVAAHERITPGIFHKLTGALTSKGHQILSAEIHTLPEDQILDRFFVTDMDFSGVPPPHRFEEVSEALVAALHDGSNKPPAFRKIWGTSQPKASGVRPLPTRVAIDNNTSERFTILDIYTHDRMGLLYAITRTIFELGLSVRVAKIGTYLDQVVDVFYVTDMQGRKIQQDERLAEIQQRLLDAIEPPPEEPAKSDGARELVHTGL